MNLRLVIFTFRMNHHKNIISVLIRVAHVSLTWFSDLLKEDQNSSSNISTSPPERAAVTLPNLLNLKLRRDDQKLLDTLEELQTTDPNVLSEHHSYYRIFLLSFYFSSIQRNVNQSKLTQDFAYFYWSMLMKFFFKNEPTSKDLGKCLLFLPSRPADFQRVTLTLRFF